MTELWIVGKSVDCSECGADGGRWEFMGVFDSHEKAVAACTEWEHFVGPAILNQREPDETVEWIGNYYPLAENPDGTLLRD